MTLAAISNEDLSLDTSADIYIYRCGGGGEASAERRRVEVNAVIKYLRVS